jgi:hypothetical protein
LNPEAFSRFTAAEGFDKLSAATEKKMNANLLLLALLGLLLLRSGTGAVC